MAHRKSRKFSDEFKRQAVILYLDGNQSRRAVARTLDVDVKLLARWAKDPRHAPVASPDDQLGLTRGLGGTQSPMHPNMRITKGMATEARLAPKYGVNLANGLRLIDHWVDEVCEELQTAPFGEACGDRLFYKDGLFDDLMLRLYREPVSRGGYTDLVLARIRLAAGQRGRGHFSALRVHLEQRAEKMGARFIVECANPVLGGKLRSTGKYTRFEYRSDPLGIWLEGPFDNWLHDPKAALKEISLPIPTVCFQEIRRNLVHMDSSQLEALQRTIAAFVKQISAKTGGVDRVAS